jgi:hypothetical protein
MVHAGKRPSPGGFTVYLLQLRKNRPMSPLLAMQHHCSFVQNNERGASWSGSKRRERGRRWRAHRHRQSGRTDLLDGSASLYREGSTSGSSNRRYACSRRPAVLARTAPGRVVMRLSDVVLCDSPTCGAILRLDTGAGPISVAPQRDQFGSFFTCPRCHQRTMLAPADGVPAPMEGADASDTVGRPTQAA